MCSASKITQVPGAGKKKEGKMTKRHGGGKARRARPHGTKLNWARHSIHKEGEAGVCVQRARCRFPACSTQKHHPGGRERELSLPSCF